MGGDDVVPFDEPEYRRWWVAAESSLETATLVTEHGQHHYGCLAAEQSAQQALTGLLHGVGRGPEAHGHDLVAIARRSAADSGVDLPEDLESALMRLTRHYLPARYPDALNGASPPTRFGPEDSCDAIAGSRATLDFVAREPGRRSRPQQARVVSGDRPRCRRPATR